MAAEIDSLASSQLQGPSAPALGAVTAGQIGGLAVAVLDNLAAFT